MRFRYRGETPGKGVSRWLIWWQHQRQLGARFYETPHAFLASRIVGDVRPLLAMGVPEDWIWAIDSDPIEFKYVIELARAQGYSAFGDSVEIVTERFAGEISSLYLDFCGNLQGSAKVLRRVLPTLPAECVVTVTLFLGREQYNVGDREVALLRQMRVGAKHHVELVQSVAYSSGSPMMTWTFYLGKHYAKGTMRFDLNCIMPDKLAELADSEDATRALWLAELERVDPPIPQPTKQFRPRSSTRLPQSRTSRGRQVST